MLEVKGNWPEDILMEILSRLPVKTLLRLTCTCKSLNALIKSADFLYAHTNNYDDDNSQLIVSYIEGDSQSSFTIFYPDETLVDLSYRYLDPESPDVGIILNSQDGLLCVYRHDYIILWNLMTKDIRNLSLCRDNLPENNDAYRPHVGYGFDPITKDYKLVTISRMWDKKQLIMPESLSHVAVYTFKDDKWRLFGESGLINYHIWGNMQYFKGICYGVAVRKDAQKAVIAFHIGDEVFEEFNGPPIGEHDSAILGIYNDNLSLILVATTDGCFEIYVLNGKSFVKQTTIGPIQGVAEPIGLWKRGIFFTENFIEHLLLYNPVSKKLKDLGVGRCFIEIEVYKYKASLMKTIHI